MPKTNKTEKTQQKDKNKTKIKAEEKTGTKRKAKAKADTKIEAKAEIKAEVKASTKAKTKAVTKAETKEKNKAKVKAAAPKVSIIIPFFNVEDYLEECLNSVVSQTLNDIEIILINDASTDNSRNVAESFAKKDKRIKIIDIKYRQGQGHARNIGIDNAKGEYIGFVDSDDFIEKDMYSLLYEKAVQTDSDITMCQVREYDDMNGKYSSSDYYSLACLGLFVDSVFAAEDTKNDLLNINVALWNKVYKREYLLNTGERFPEGYIYEDLPFFFGTYLPAKRLSIVWKSLYNYRINRKNSTMQHFNNKILDRPPMVVLTYEKIKSVPYFEEIKKQVQGWIVEDLFHRYVLLKDKFHKEFFFLMKKVFTYLKIEDPTSPYWSNFYHFNGYNLVMDNTYEDFNQKIFNNYTDFHEMEKLFESKTISAGVLNVKFTQIYKSFEDVYDYIKKTSKGTLDEAGKKICDVYVDIDKSNDYLKQNNIEIRRDLKKYTNDQVTNAIIDITAETDKKIGLVYEEITKNYDYTAQKNDELKENLTEDLKNNSQYFSSQIDEKVSSVFGEITKTYDYINEKDNEVKSDIQKVYEEITRNYEYTNQKNDELKESLTEEIKNNSQYFNSQIDEKVSSVFGEITKTYDYVNEKDNEVKTDIQKVYEEITRNYEYTNQKNDELKESLTEEIKNNSQYFNTQVDEKISQVYEEISRNYDFTNDKNEELKEGLIKEFDEKIRNNTISINTDTDNKINEVYDNITKSYDYINEKDNEHKEDIKKVYEEITRNYSYTNDEVDNLKLETIKSISNSEQTLRDLLKSQIKEAKETLKSELITTVSATSKTMSTSANNKFLEISDEISKFKESIAIQQNKIKEEKNSLVEKESQIYEYIDSIVNSAQENLEIIAKGTTKELEDTKSEFENSLKQSANDLRDEIFTQKAYIEGDTDGKLGKIYEQMAENQQNSVIQIQALRNKINDDINNLKSQSDYGQQQIYDEINKNLQYTNDVSDGLKNEFSKQLQEKTSGLYNDIKDLSYVLNDNFSQLTQEQLNIKETTDKLINSGEEKFAYLQSELNNKFNSASAVIKDTENKFNAIINNLENIIKEEKQNSANTIQEIKAEFLSVLEKQQKKNEEQVLELKSQIEILEKNIREEIKSPIIKIIEKHTKKTENK